MQKFEERREKGVQADRRMLYIYDKMTPSDVVR